MATLTRRMKDVEERTDSLETIFAAFMARTDASMGRTDETIGRLERMIERREQEGAREREEAARERKEMNQRWGELANKMGTVVEDIVAPSIRRLAREVFGCGGLQVLTAVQAQGGLDDQMHVKGGEIGAAGGGQAVDAVLEVVRGMAR